jgi:HSP20 family molecular chaperone IbpA
MKRFLFPSLFEELCGATSCAAPSCGPASCCSPSGVSISEDEHKLYIDASVAGVNSKEIQLTLDQENGVLKIFAESKDKRENVQYHLRNPKRYCYEIPLSMQNLDLSKPIEATCKDGILTVQLLKTQIPAPLKIEVKIA